jgi:integrase
MGLPAWAAEQEKRGYTLFQPGPKPLTSSVWSKRFARYIGEIISEDPTLVLYSLRHSFRQMLRAAAIGEELADKIFGHTSDRVGANYGRTLSSQEAALFIERVRPPIDLDHLWRTGS